MDVDISYAELIERVIVTSLETCLKIRIILFQRISI